MIGEYSISSILSQKASFEETDSMGRVVLSLLRSEHDQF